MRPYKKEGTYGGRAAGIILACLVALCACIQQPGRTNKYDPESNSTMPCVVSTAPAAKGVDVATGTAITIEFNTTLDRLSVTTDSVLVYDIENNRIMGVVSCDGASVTFAPVVALLHAHTYSVVLTGVIQSISGIKMASPYVWCFTTAAECIPAMVPVGGGTFQMGSTTEKIKVVGVPYNAEVRSPQSSYLEYLTCEASKPVHSVTVSDFQIGKYEVTFEEYDEFCDSTGGRRPDDYWGRGRMPVINVTWFEAVEYCNWLSSVRGYDPCYAINGMDVICDFSKNGYRLPTEAEWEYAARGGGTTPGFAYSGCEADAAPENDNYINIKNFTWCTINASTATHEVGTKNPNVLGICDMSGNVAEWCWDWYDENYYSSCNSKGTVENPTGPDDPVLTPELYDYRKVTRGGGYLSDFEFYATAIRGCEGPGSTNWPNINAPQVPGSVMVNKMGDLGFRVCRRPYGNE